MQIFSFCSKSCFWMFVWWAFADLINSNACTNVWKLLNWSDLKKVAKTFFKNAIYANVIIVKIYNIPQASVDLARWFPSCLLSDTHFNAASQLFHHFDLCGRTSLSSGLLYRTLHLCAAADFFIGIDRNLRLTKIRESSAESLCWTALLKCSANVRPIRKK